MLPEFPVLKDELNRAITRFMRMRASLYGGVTATVPQSRTFEGHQHVISRPGEEPEPSKMFQASSEVKFSGDEIQDIRLDQVLARLDQIAKDMAEQKAKQFFATITEGSQRAGTAVDAKGSPLTPELYLETLQKMLVAFHSDGSPIMPTLVVHPNMRDTVEAMKNQIENDPILRRRFEEIMRNKREEWRAREADRSLVG